MDRTTARRRGLTLIESLSALAVLAIVFALLFPALQLAREAARRVQCQQRLRQLGGGLQHHQSIKGRYPPGRVAPDWVRRGRVRVRYTNYTAVGKRDRTGFYSVHLRLLPYIDQQAVYDLIAFEEAQMKRMTRRGRPANNNYRAYATARGLFLCPSDPGPRRLVSENSYRCNFGGSTPYGGAPSTRQQATPGSRAAGNGAFTYGAGLDIGDFPDGLANTAFFSERLVGSGGRASVDLPGPNDVVTMPGRRDAPVATDQMFARCGDYVARVSPFNFTAAGRWIGDWSSGWPFAGYDATQYNHVAPPNWSGQDCGNWSTIADTPGEHAIVTARSHHPGTVNVLFGDGRVVSISETVALTVWRQWGDRGRTAPGNAT